METVPRNVQPGRVHPDAGLLRCVCLVCLLAYVGVCLIGCGQVASYGDEQAAVDDAFMSLAVVLTASEQSSMNEQPNHKTQGSPQNIKRVLYFTASWCGPLRYLAERTVAQTVRERLGGPNRNHRRRPESRTRQSIQHKSYSSNFRSDRKRKRNRATNRVCQCGRLCRLG